MINGNFAYVDDGSVYFDIKSSPKYGKLANLVFEETRAADRFQEDEYQKKSAQDFALWKSHKESDGNNYWKSPWGDGRPSWH